MELIYKIAFYLNLIIIEYLATTSKNIEIIANIWDKAKHSFAFFVLYVLISLSYKRVKTVQKAFLLLLFGIQIEFVQYFIPGRESSLLDIFADCIGIVLGILMLKTGVMRFFFKYNFF